MANGTCILVVDDEEVDLAAISRGLRTHGHTIVEAHGYRDALAAFNLNRNAVQLVVTDISLPDGNGCSLALALHEQRSDLLFLFISGHVGAEICKFYGLDVGDDYFLRKPFNEDQLLSAVRKVLTAPRPFPTILHRTS